MIQVYKEDNTDYEHNGDCVLMPTECHVYATINEAWSAELVHPIDPEGKWNYLTAQAVVKMPSFNGEQLFRIKSRQKSLTEVACKLEPIFYDAGGDCWLFNVRPTNKTGQEALELMAAANEKYSVSSDITSKATAYYEWVTLLEAISGDEENTFLRRWGGEILYDNFTIIINKQIGEDNGLEIRYGKNLRGIEETVDMQDLVTRIWPKTYAGHPTKYGYIKSPREGDYPIVRQCTITYDNIRYKDDINDEAKEIEEGRIVVHNQDEIDHALYQAVTESFAAGIDRPVITLSVDMVQLGNTEQYAEFRGLESVSLGDTVHVFSENIGITTAMRVFSLEYDALRERVDKITLGSEAYNYFKNQSKDIRITQNALSDAQGQIADLNIFAEDTDLTLAEVIDVTDDEVTLKGAKLRADNWSADSKGISFSEQQTRAGTFRMVTEEGKVVFQAYDSVNEEWEDIGYLMRFTQSGDNVLGLVSAPNQNARIWVEDADKYVWLSAPEGYINMYASDGKVTIMGDDVLVQAENQPMASWPKQLYDFHPFHFEHVAINAPNGWQVVYPPGGTYPDGSTWKCKYLIQAADYSNTSTSAQVVSVQNRDDSDGWTLNFSAARTTGYVTCIWI